MACADTRQWKVVCGHGDLARRGRAGSPIAAKTWIFFATAVLAAAAGGPVFAAATDITIATAPAPATPRILGPGVVAFTPGSPLLYTISATGQAPLAFAATGLPSGLTLDASAGTISGTTPAAGSYPVNLTVSNASGSASRTLTIVAGATLALTPPMGWNSYDSFGANVKESDVKAAADAMKTLLQPYGWNTVVIDYLWYDPEDTIDANGRWLPSTSKYPSATGADGFKSVAAYVHSRGLSFGIHLMRGIPRVSVQKNTPVLNSTYTASQAGNTSDTCSWDSHMYGVNADAAAGKAWYDSIYQQYADWGVDFVKVDDMMNPYATGQPLHSSEVQAVHASIGKTGRSIILSLSPGPTQTRDVAVLNANANMWRQVNDFWDTNGLSSMSNEFDAALAWSQTSGITPGHWPDADMLPLGTIGTRQCAFSHNQQVQVMTLWAIMPSPLIFGGQVTKLSTDSWTLALLTNEEIIAIDQDALGARGKQVTATGGATGTAVWSKDLADGRKAVALFNRGSQDATVSVTFAQLGMTGTPPVRDCWNKKDVTGMTSGISVNVPHDSALMYTVGVASGGASGSGGSSGAGGATGAGGGAVPGSDGSVAAGGATGDASAASTGGTSSGSGGAAGAGNGGSVGRGGAAGGATGGSGGATAQASGGAQTSAGGQNGHGGASTGNGGTGGGSGSGGTASNGSGGSTGTTTGSGNAQSGCSCALGSRHTSHSGWLVLLAAAAFVLARPRRRDRR